jgi:hypothetical protein
MPRSTRTLEMSHTRIASHPASVMRSTSASLRSFRSSTNSIGSSQLSQGLSPRDCASTSTAPCKSRSRSLLLSSTFFSPRILSRPRECMELAVCTSILVRYSFRVALAFTRSVSRSGLTLTRAFSKILALSSCAARASSLHVNTSSHARSCSCNSSAATVEGNGGGDLHKPNTDDQRRIRR